MRCDVTPTCPAEGCIAFDASGLGNHVRILAPASFVQGRFGSGLSTNQMGADGCRGPALTQATVTGFPSGTTPFTIAAWLRQGPSGIIAGYSRSAGWILQVQAGTGLMFYANAICSAPGALPADGAWHMVAATAEVGKLAIYVDGAPVASCAAPDYMLFGDGAFALAAAPTITACPFQGAIDEVRVLALAESAVEIAADFAAGRLQRVPGTVGLWHLDEGLESRCCAAGSTCRPDGACGQAATSTAVCPVDAPLACGDGRCCLNGTRCSPGGCAVVAPAPAECPVTSPVPCGDICCAEGTSCAPDGLCVPHMSSPGGAACGPSEVGVDGGTDGDYCCPSYPAVGFVIAARTPCGSVEHHCALDLMSCNGGGCPAGFSCCPGSNRCTAPGTPAPACPDGGTMCTWTGSYNDSACCPAGTVCGQAHGYCCPSGQALCPWSYGCGDVCQADSEYARCPDGETRCDGRCCPSGTVCREDDCIIAEAEPALCESGGQPCGSVCCPDGTVCNGSGACMDAGIDTLCDAGSPVVCYPQASACCRQGEVCEESDGGAAIVCLPTVPFVERGGPDGPGCGEGEFCESSEVCGGEEQCCPLEHPQACGDLCCAGDLQCVDGECACGPGQTECGALCCAPGKACIDGRCEGACAEAGFPVVCGDSCCAEEVECREGACVCPPSHPVVCDDLTGGGACCLAGAPCEAGVCGCPEEAVACGDLCCAAGERCEGGRCTAPSQGDDCTPDEGACSSDADCCGSAICVSGRSCIRGFSGCECAGSSAGRCFDYLNAGFDVTQCGTCSQSYTACCAGQTCVNGTCEASCD